MGEILGGKEPAARRPIYVEIGIRAPMERVWTLSQDPALHPRWDLRFSRIVPEPGDGQGPVCFRYEFRLPFHCIQGVGTSLGHRYRPDGQATSVLKFDTADVFSPIGPGSGYWRYIPTKDGLRFITGYNYRPGMGILGRILDSSVIRPALGWATATSFDRLRIWAESDLDPAESRNRWFFDAAARAGGLLAAGFLVRQALTGRTRLPQLSAWLQVWLHASCRPTRLYPGQGGVCGGLLTRARRMSPPPSPGFRHPPHALQATKPEVRSNHGIDF